MDIHGHPMRAQVKTANLDGELALKLCLSAGIYDSHPIIDALADRFPAMAEEICAALDRRAAHRAARDEGGYDDDYEVPPPAPTVEHTFAACVLSTEKHRLRVWPCPLTGR